MACRRLLPVAGQPQPGREVATRSEGLAGADRGYERGRVERADPRDAEEAPCGCFLKGACYELSREICDAPVEGSPFEAHILD